MKYYYRLAQQFIPENNEENLTNYLDQSGINYSVSADFTADLRRLGLIANLADTGPFLKIYTVLVEEEALSLIKLRVDGVHMIKDSRSIRIKNKIRKILSIFFK